MAGIIATEPWWTILDANGNPVSGAKIYVYDAGTSTPFVVYQDAALTVPHAQPAVADSAGRITIYLPPQSSVKVAIYTSGSVLIRETDPITTPDLGAALETALDTFRQAFIAWPGSDSAALTGTTYPSGLTNAARAPGTGLFTLTQSVDVLLEATIWVEAGGVATVALFATSAPDTPIPFTALTTTNADGAVVQSSVVTLTAGTYFIKGHSANAAFLAYAVGYRLIPS